METARTIMKDMNLHTVHDSNIYGIIIPELQGSQEFFLVLLYQETMEQLLNISSKFMQAILS